MSLTADTLADLLRREIEDGKLAPGSKLPSITALMDQYDVGKKLRDTGMIATKPGGATFVKGGHTRLVVQMPMSEGASSGDTEVISVAEVREAPAPDLVAREMGIEPGAPVFMRHSTYGVDRRPVQLVSVFLPLDLAHGSAIVYTDVGEGGVHARLEVQGFGPNRFTVSTISRLAAPEEEEYMRLRRGTYVLEATQIAFSGRRCVEVLRLVLDPAVHELRVNLMS